MTITNTAKVSNALRNANSNAISKREAWRRQYQEITLMIRNAKSKRRNGSLEHRLLLSSLRSQANWMMIHRDTIRSELRETAYTYV